MPVLPCASFFSRVQMCMRVVLIREGTPEPCGMIGLFEQGAEVEDYTIQVMNYCPASASCSVYAISRVQFNAYYRK